MQATNHAPCTGLPDFTMHLIQATNLHHNAHHTGHTFHLHTSYTSHQAPSHMPPLSTETSFRRSYEAVCSFKFINLYHGFNVVHRASSAKTYKIIFMESKTIQQIICGVETLHTN